jgi:hypothetical protein
MQFKTGDLVKHKWAYGDNVYILLEENCGYPLIIGSNRGFAKVQFIFHGSNYAYAGSPIKYVSRLIMQKEWCYADEKGE